VTKVIGTIDTLRKKKDIGFRPMVILDCEWNESVRFGR